MGFFDRFLPKPKNSGPPRPAGIELLKDGFALHDGKGGSGEVRFDDIHEVFAFKRPQGATRYVCLGIQTEFEGEPVVVDEGMDGYRALMDVLLVRFKIDEVELQLRVMKGKGGPNPTRLWRKRGDTFKR